VEIHSRMIDYRKMFFISYLINGRDGRIVVALSFETVR